MRNAAGHGCRGLVEHGPGDVQQIDCCLIFRHEISYNKYISAAETASPPKKECCAAASKGEEGTPWGLRTPRPCCAERAQRRSCLLHNDLADHAGTLVGLAVVAVLAGGVELGGGLLAGGVQVVLMGQGISVHAGLHIGTEREESSRSGLETCGLRVEDLQGMRECKRRKRNA